MWTSILFLLSFVVYSLQDALKCRGGLNFTGHFAAPRPATNVNARHISILTPGSLCGPQVPELTGTPPGAFYLITCTGCPGCNLTLPPAVNFILIANQAEVPTGALGTNTFLFYPTATGNPLATDLDDCQFEIANGISADSTDALRSFSKTSVLFVSISFIILMVISLAWLVFYYVQRFRYAHAKDRLQRRLFNAAKKALARIPARSLRSGDPELDTDCPVCIDPYAAGDVVRTLPCRHVFHKTCIDPWLLEHRTCPMCKGDILKAFGYQVSVGGEGSRGEEREAVRDVESPDPPSTASESGVFPFQANNEMHDPFSFTPTSSPQLVLNNSNAKNFTIVPLTVHSKPTSAVSRDAVIVEQVEPPPVAVVEKKQERAASAGEAGPSSVTRLGPVRGQSQGQLVNLVQVRSRSMSVARAATLRGRLETQNSPTPVETSHSTESI